MAISAETGWEPSAIVFVPVVVIVSQRYTTRGNFLSKSTGEQGGEPTLNQWPQCYRVWYEIEIFQINLKNN